MKRGIAALVAATLLLAACGGSAAPQAQTHGQRLTVALNVEPDTLDPAAQTTTPVSALVNMAVEELVGYDADGKLAPRLATSWQTSEDSLAYTFTLRKGVRFHDGTSFDAAAVKRSIDRLWSPATFKAQPGVLTVIKDVQVVDPDHVRISLKAPFAPFLDALSQTVAGIISPASIGRDGNTDATIVHPVGTGAYSFGEFVKGDHVLLQANRGYWGPKPAYDTQLYKIVPDAAAGESLIKAGQADVVFNPPPNDLSALGADTGLRVLRLPSDRTVFISINTLDSRVPALQKREVRQALNYAVDKDALIKNLTFGATVKDDAPIAPGVFGYCKVGSYPYDPAKAKRMLAQAGAGNMQVTFRSPQGRYIADYQVAQAIAGNLRAVGVSVDLPNPPDWKTYQAQVLLPPEQSTTDLALRGWAPSVLDASQQMQMFQRAYIPPGGSNVSYYQTAEVEQLVTKANAEKDEKQRQTDYCHAAQVIWNDAPWIFLWHQTNPVVTTSKIAGVYGLRNEQVVTTWARPA